MDAALAPWIVSQAILTFGLVMLLHLLQANMHRQEFFRLWIIAWTCFATWLVVGLAHVRVGGGSLIRLVLVFVATAAGYFHPLAIYLGARALDRETPRRIRHYVVVTIIVAASVSVVSVLLKAPLASFAVRNLPRQAALVLACSYAALAIWQRVRDQSHGGALAISAGCAGFALVQLWLVLNYLGLHFPMFAAAQTYASFLASYFCELAIVAGMMLVLLRRNALVQAKLLLYEKIVPTCCVCGAVRDDEAGGGSQGEWINLQAYVARRAGARFSHTFCPLCLIEYRVRQGLLPAPPTKAGSL